MDKCTTVEHGPYEAPAIVTLGKFADLTEAANLVNGDVPGGGQNAYS